MPEYAAITSLTVKPVGGMCVLGTFRLDNAAFRRIRGWWLLAMLLPSLAVDAVLLFRLLTLDPVMLDPAGKPDAGEIIKLFLANAVFLKSEGIAVYFLLRSHRRGSAVRIGPRELVYRKKRVVGYTFYYHYRIFADYHIRAPVSVEVRKNGTAVVRGEIEVVYYLRNGTDVHSAGVKRRCVIPGYFENMAVIHRRLLQLTQPCVPAETTEPGGPTADDKHHKRFIQ
jgi:hypothetical protein